MTRRFGKDHVFKDREAIKAGEDVTKVIDRELDSCGAMIALIGREWLTVTDPDGNRRPDDPSDFVRQELEAALQVDDVLLMPILVGDVDMPDSRDLPNSLVDMCTKPSRYAWKRSKSPERTSPSRPVR